MSTTLLDKNKFNQCHYNWIMWTLGMIAPYVRNMTGTQRMVIKLAYRKSICDQVLPLRFVLEVALATVQTAAYLH